MYSSKDLVNWTDCGVIPVAGKNGGNGSTGKKNLHTMYFENLFSEENLKCAKTA